LTTARAPRRAPGWASRVLGAAGLVACFAGAAASGIVVHANVPVARRLAARAVASVLSDVLAGSVAVEPFTRIEPHRVTVPRATLVDAFGHRVLTLEDVRVDLDLWPLARGLLSHDGPRVVVRYVRVERTAVELLPDPRTGELTIARAIVPTAAPAKQGASISATRVYLPAVELGTITVRAALEDAPLTAEIRGLRGRLYASPKGLAVDVDRFGAVLHGRGTDAHGTGTLSVRAPGPIQGTFDGFLGDVELEAQARLEANRLTSSLDVRSASPSAMERVVPGWPLTETLTGHLEASGELPDLDVRGTLRAGPSDLRAEGKLHAANPARATLAVTARHFDLGLVSRGAPTTDVDGTAIVEGHFESGVLVASVTGRTRATVVNGERVPQVEVECTVEKGRVVGKAVVDEPGLPLSAAFDVTPSGAVDIDASTARLDLRRIDRRLPRGIGGTGRARLRAHVERGEVRASLDADLGGLSAPGARARRAHVVADVSGPLDAPERLTGTVRADGTDLDVNGLALDRARVTLRGTAASASFDAEIGAALGLDVRASGKTTLSKHPVLRDTSLTWTRGPVVVKGDVLAFDPEAKRLDVRRLEITGAGGTLVGSARLRPDLVEVEAEGENLDLDAIGSALGLPRGTLGGRMRISLDLDAGHDVTRGRVRLGLGNVTVGTVGGLSAEVSADLEDRKLSGTASGLLAGLGTFGASFDGELGGPAFEAASYRDVTGKADVRLSEVELAALSMLLPRGTPIAYVGGQAFARFLLERKSAKAPLPNVFATLGTRGLSFDVERSRGASLPVRGFDVNLTGAFNGETGDSTGTLLVVDPRGELATASGSLRVDVPRLVREPGRAPSELVDTPLDVVVVVPRRAVPDFPELVRPPGLAGGLGAIVSLRGTLAHPTFFASVDGVGLTPSGSDGTRAVDVHADAQYEWNTSALSARARASAAGREIATASFRGSVPGSAPESWVGKGRVELERLPLELFAALAKNGVNGTVSGNASLERTASGGAVDVTLDTADAVVERAALGAGHLELHGAGSTLRATVGVRGEHGSLDADASASIRWDGPVPSVSTAGPLRAHVVAKDFGAAAFSPFVSGVVSHLGGRVGGDLTVSLEPSAGGPGERLGGTIEGGVTVEDGSLLIDALGLEIRNVSFAADARGAGGTTTLSVRDARGRVRGAEDNLHASATLTLDGLRVVRGKGSLEADDMPILFRGAPQGRITGHAEALLTREPDRMVVAVDVPALTLVLPQSSARNVIDLGEDEDVEVVQLERDEGEAGPVLPWQLALKLGRDVSLRRSDIDLGVSGEPVIELGSEAAVTGKVELTPGGRVPVLGKVFIIDHGSAVFDTGDPSNPRLNVTATWRGPNDTIVYVDVTGTLKRSKIALRSDPPLPEAEVIALLLGGSSSDTGTAAPSSQQGGGAAAGAVALGSGVAALGVNELLTNNPVELRVETTEESRPRYTAAVRVRQDLWFEASTYQQSTGVGTGTDRNVFSGTVDYRFTRRWSLRTEVGTVGGAMDLLWQYRY
jgi:translocation and assembly module TamB